jgi:AmmeMemoRadiSam system protein A
MPGQAAGESRSLSDTARAELLLIAREAVSRYLKDGTVPSGPPSHSRLAEPGAAFVTLTAGGHLRGCIGYTEVVAPLYRVVREVAVAAATEDPRFPPVSPGELGSLRFAVSVLAAPRPIRPEAVRVGTHGLIVSQGGQKGLLLPQVAVEHGWSPEVFLSRACVKAGLSPDAWREGAEIQAFTAELFSENH